MLNGLYLKKLRQPLAPERSHGRFTPIALKSRDEAASPVSPPLKHPQISASVKLPDQKYPGASGRASHLQYKFACFETEDARLSERIFRKEWHRDEIPDHYVLRLFTKAWEDPKGYLWKHGFVAFFRTDRDTLGLIFEDEQAIRYLWALDIKTRTPRRLGTTP